MKRWSHLVLVVVVTAAAHYLPSTHAGFTPTNTEATTGRPTKTAPGRKSSGIGPTASPAAKRREVINSIRKCSVDANAASSPLFRSALALVDGNATATAVAATAEQGTHAFIVQIVLRRLAQFKSTFAVTCNAAVTFLAAQYLGAVLLFGIASSSSVLVSPTGAVGQTYTDYLPPTGPVAAVMRVAPAGATPATTTYTPSPVTWPRSSEVAQILAGGSAAVAGAVLGRKVFYKHIDDKAKDDEEEIDELGTCSKDEGLDAPSAEPGSTPRSNLSSVEPNVLLNASPSTTDNIPESDSSEPAQSGLASKLLVEGRDSGQRDFQRMRNLLETRLEREAAEREKARSEQARSEQAGLASKLQVESRDSVQRDFQRMRTLLEARLEREAAEREKARSEQNKEMFHRRLLEARLRQDIADKALKVQREKEKANTITPELMSTIKMLSTQEEPTNSPPESVSRSQHHSDEAAENRKTANGSTSVPSRRNGFRSTLASVSALFSYSRK